MFEYRLQIFDLDDTLINTKDVYFDAYIKVASQVFNISNQLSTHLLPGLFNIYGSSDTKGIFEGMTSLLGLPENLEQISFCVDKFQSLYWSNLRLYPGVDDYLQQQINNKHKIFICSNGQESVQLKKINLLGLNKYFNSQQIFISSSFVATYAKPSPKMVLSILDLANELPSQSCFFGNSIIDFIAAKKARLDFLLFNKRATDIFDNDPIKKQLSIVFDDWSQVLQN